MECTSVTTQLLCPQEKAPLQFYRRKRVDLWQEIKKRWLLLAVLLCVVLAVISPRIGAPAGPLYTKYLVHIPLSYIYYESGASYTRAGGVSNARGVSPARVSIVACLHAHVVSPALAAAFSVLLADHSLVKPTIFAAVGPPCSWLALSLSHSALVPLVATYAVSLILTPLTMTLLCGTLWYPPVVPTALSLAASGVPTYAGVWRARRVTRASEARAGTCEAALLCVVWVDCSGRLWEAEGGMLVGDVMFLLVLELCYLSASCVCVFMYCRLGFLDPPQAVDVALVALPKCFDLGWQASVPCVGRGLAGLGGAFTAPAQALLAVSLARPLPARHSITHSNKTEWLPNYNYNLANKMMEDN